jgi:predicted AlkP superfamily pyrophosphatase or phosphodiesterase
MSVFPSVTYPSHTSIASGVVPGRHGIVSNSSFDPLDENMGAWRWYAADVKVPRVWDLARDAGYTTALLDWPVTVGAQATYHVPEFWRARVDEDIKLIDALSTPGLLAEVGQAFPSFLSGFRPQKVTDEAGTDLAVHLIQKAKPNLIFLHVWQVNAAQHHHGLWSEEAKAAIENADRQIGRLVAATEAAGIAEHTAIVIASDHGFFDVQRCVNPAVLLRQAGLLTVNAQGKVSAWQAALLASGGSAYVYLNPPGDEQLQQKVRAVFERAQKSGDRGIARVLDHDAIVQLGGDPQAFLALEPELGVYIGSSVARYDSPPSYKAVHGYDPNRPEMRASLLLYGAGIKHGTLVDAQLVDVAPTVAGWLGLEMPNVDGRPLRVTESEPAP